MPDVTVYIHWQLNGLTGDNVNVGLVSQWRLWMAFGNSCDNNGHLLYHASSFFPRNIGTTQSFTQLVDITACRSTGVLPWPSRQLSALKALLTSGNYHCTALCAGPRGAILDQGTWKKTGRLGWSVPMGSQLSCHYRGWNGREIMYHIEQKWVSLK